MPKTKKKTPKKPVSKKKVVKKPQKPAIQPLGNRALIRPFTKDELATKNAFGIILPGADKKEKAEQGVVLTVGPGSYIDGKFVATTIKAGDVVAFSKYGFDDITLDGEELYLIKEENILAIINK
jgi:chaperonin GroES